MNKISVGETILHGYGFARRRIIPNLGLSWLAAVFYAVAAGYWLHQFCTTMLVSPHPGSELNDFALFDLFGLVVTTALGSAVIMRALTGAALEPGGETMTAYFAVAKREWILFLSLLRLYAFVIAALFAVVFLAGLAITMALPMIGANAQWQGIGAMPAMNVAAAVVAFVVIATLAVRLGFFAAPVASAERSTSMARAWSLSRGNSWRVFAVATGLSVPALLLWAVGVYALTGNDLTGALSPGHDSTAFYQLIDTNAPVIAGTWAVLIVVLNVLFAGASAPAYLTVRDNVTARQSGPVSREPVLEPIFAGSFAGFAPRHAKEPAASDVRSAESAPETFTAVSKSEAPMAAAEIPAETSVTELETVAPQTEEVTAPSHEGKAHEPMVLTEEVYEATSHVVPEDTVIAAAPATAAQFPLGPDTASEHLAANMETAGAGFHAETNEITPPPLHDDGTEPSQRNVPSEAA